MANVIKVIKGVKKVIGKSTSKPVASKSAPAKKASGDVKKIKGGSKPLSRGNPMLDSRGQKMTKPPVKSPIVNRETSKGVTVNNKGKFNFGNARTSKDKIKYGN
jgi:hypothetical protein